MGVATLTIAAMVGGLTGATAAEEEPQQSLFELVGTLSRYPPDARAALGDALVPTADEVEFFRAPDIGTLIMIPEVRQVWQIFYGSEAGTEMWAAVVRDLDSLQIIKQITFPTGLERNGKGATRGGEWTHAVDTIGGRLFLTSRFDTDLLEIDLRSFEITSRPLVAKLSPFPTAVPIVIGGITYDPYNDDVLFLYGGPPTTSVGNASTFLYTLDVSVPPGDQSDLSGFYRLRSCSAPVTSTDVQDVTSSWELLVAKDFLYVPCQRAGHTGQVVRMTRPERLGATPTKVQDQLSHPEDVVVGPVYIETVLADPAAGRLYLTTTRREIWVFEASTMSFLGIVATGPEDTTESTGYGLDRATGRLFFQSPTFGLGIAEGRFFPVPQARTMPRLAEGQERILIDSRTGRIFVLEGSEAEKANAYRIYRTDPAPVPPPPPDPDRNTIDMAEREGITESRYFASGSGYGVRAFLAKGVSTVPPAPTLGVVAPTAQLIDKHLNLDCGYTDRELVAGRVHKAEYDTGSTAASAIAVDVDGATKQDLDKPARCDMRGRDSSGTEVFPGIFNTAPPLDDATQQQDDPNTPEQETRWPFRPATCSSSEGGEPQKGDGTGSLPADIALGPSKVSCPTPGDKLTASATAELIGGVSVGRAWTTTTIERGPFGVRSTVESVAQDVNIAGGAITFAEIRSTAISTGNGRPKKGEMSEHDTVIRGAHIEGDPVCSVCADLTELVDTLNAAASGRAIFRTGSGATSGRDEDLLQGSPGGAQTAVQKSPARQASDQALIGDFTNEIPGLEMLVFNDNTEWGRARQLYQFAGVSTAATYNIVLVPPAFPLPDLPTPELPVAPPDVPSDIAPRLAPPAATSIDEGVSSADGFGPQRADQIRQDRPVAAARPTPVEDDDSILDRAILEPFRALDRGLRLLLSDPRHVMLLLTAWALFSLPWILSRRRQLLAAARA